MKAIKLFIALGFISSLALWSSCANEELNPVPAWETAVHGDAKIVVTPNVAYDIVVKTKTISKPEKDSFFVQTNKKTWIDSMSLNDLSKTARFTHNWNSVDKLNTVTKIDFYVYWDEAYTDKNKNPRTARHGGFIFEDPGKLFKSVTPKGNREEVEYTISLSEIYNLYKDAKFDYLDGKGTVSVIDGTVRTASKPFTKNDKFTIRWALTTTDGRIFEVWNPDICTGTVPGLTCSLVIPTK